MTSLHLSRPHEEHHSFVLRLPGAARVLVAFVDESEPRDITSWVPDLALVGLASRHRELAGLEGRAEDVVEVARVTLDGADPGEVGAIYTHPPTGVAVDVTWPELADLVGRGVSEQVTSGVAHEVAEESL
jgi:hypothetical protein